MRYLIFCLAIFPCATFATILTSTEFITGIPGVSDIGSFEISPDGRHLYAISNAENLLAGFSIDNLSGSLISIDIETVGIPANGSTLGTHLRLSPNGSLIYVAGDSSNALTLYIRNNQSGELTLVTNDAAQIPADQIIKSISISPDGLNLYAITSPLTPLPGFVSTVYVYAIDPQSGALGLQQNLTLSDTQNVTGFFSPDGNYFYIAEDTLSTGGQTTFALFNRNALGNLSFIGPSQISVASLSSEVPAMSSTGDSVYLLDSFLSTPPSGFLTTLERNAGNGQFSNSSRITGIFPRGIGDDAIKLIDGDRILIVDNPLSLFRIPESGGNPIQLEGQITNSNTASLNGLQPALAVNIDQRFLYVAGPEGIAIFRIEPLKLGDIPEVPSLNNYGLSVLILALLLIMGWTYQYRDSSCSTG